MLVVSTACLASTEHRIVRAVPGIITFLLIHVSVLSQKYEENSCTQKATDCLERPRPGVSEEFHKLLLFLY